MNLKYLIREYKWATTPILYILLIVVASLVYTNKNSNHETVSDKENKIDEIFIGSQISLDDITKPSVKEAQILKEILPGEYFFDLNPTTLENIDNIKNIFAIKDNGKVAMIGYLSTGTKNCKKLEYFSLSQNGKHYAKKENNTISYKLVWNSNSNQYVYYNFFKADGLDAINNCVYMITAK